MQNYVNPLSGVPKVESPFFQELFDEADPFYQAAKDLHEKGFAVIDFPEPEFDAITDRIKRDLHDRVDWANWRQHGSDVRLGNAWMTNEDVRGIAANDRILEILAHLYGRRAFPFQTLNFPVGTQQHYHSDSLHFSCLPERFMCGVWVAFEDIGPDQGPLLYYPGSHKWPIYRNEHIGHDFKMGADPTQVTFHTLWQRLVEIHGIEPEHFMPRKGQALIWSANLLHGGEIHLDRSKTRWSQVSHYYFEDCVYYTPLGSNEPAFEMLIRTPDNIATGGLVQSSYLSRPINLPLGHAPGSPGLPQFDAERYLDFNPDVRAAGGDPWKHFVWHGLAERRRWY